MNENNNVLCKKLGYSRNPQLKNFLLAHTPFLNLLDDKLDTIMFKSNKFTIIYRSLIGLDLNDPLHEKD